MNRPRASHLRVLVGSTVSSQDFCGQVFAAESAPGKPHQRSLWRFAPAKACIHLAPMRMAAETLCEGSDFGEFSTNLRNVPKIRLGHLYHAASN